MSMKIFSALVLACAATLVLTACASSQGPDPDEVVARPAPGDVFVRANAGAGDDLAARLAAKAPAGTRVLVASFVNRDDLDDTSSLGRLTSAQVATRLSRAGFDMVEARLRSKLVLRPGQGEFVLSRATADLARTEFEAQAVLLGSYTVDDEAVFVTASVVRLDNGAVLASGDYALPNAGPVARMLRDRDDGGALFERYVRDGRQSVSMAAGADAMGHAASGAMAPAAMMGEPPAPVAPPQRVAGPQRMDEPLTEQDLTALPGFNGQGYLLVPPGRPRQGGE